MIYFPLSSSSALILKRERNPEFRCGPTSAEYVTGLNVGLLTSQPYGTWQLQSVIPPLNHA